MSIERKSTAEYMKTVRARWSPERHEAAKEKMRIYSRRPDIKEAAKVRMRVQRLRVKYGITTEQAEEMLREQKGLCDLCGKPLERGSIDHCHKSGKVRGIIHPNCNTLLGMAADDITMLDAAKAYLLRHAEG